MSGLSSCGSGTDACATVGSCPSLDTFLPYQNLQLRIDYANRIFKDAGIQFYLRSVEQVAAPTLADLDASVDIPWNAVRDDIRRIFPNTVCGGPPTLSNHQLKERTWSRIGATYYSATHEITLLIHKTSGGGDGGYPWKDRALHTDVFNLSYNSHLAHELGHFLGLSHSFTNADVQLGGSDLNSPTLRNPETNAPAKYSDFWDLIYRETGDPSCGTTGSSPCFFKSKSGAQPWDNDPSIRGISWYNYGGTSYNCTRGNLNEATGSCVVNGVVRSNGDPLLAGVAFSFVGDNPPTNPVRGWNNMDYLGPLVPHWGNEQDNWLNALSQSQITQLRRVLRFDVPLDQLTLYPGLRGNRPLLGQQTNQTPALRVDFNNDGKRDLAVWEPPTAQGQLGTLKILLSPAYTTPVQVQFGRLGDIPLVSDFDGDGKTDFGVFRTGGSLGEDPTDTTGRFRWCRVLDEPCSSGGNTELGAQRLFGQRGDVPLVGTNFTNATAHGEIAVVRPSLGLLYWDTTVGLSPTPSPIATSAWNFNRTPFLALIDGDSLTDIAYYDPQTALFSVQKSSTGWPPAGTISTFPSSLIAQATGSAAQRSGAVPMVIPKGTGGQAILRVWSADDAVWYSDVGATGTIQSCQWGASSDNPLPGLLGGGADPRGNFAVYRPSAGAFGYLYFIDSNANGSCTGAPWFSKASIKFSREKLVFPAQDSDGDGFHELVVLDPTKMEWMLLYSTTSYDPFSALVVSLGGVRGVPL